MDDRYLRYKLLRGEDVQFEDFILKNYTLNYIFEVIKIETYDQITQFATNIDSIEDPELKLYLVRLFMNNFLDIGVEKYVVGFHEVFNEYTITYEDEDKIKIRRFSCKTLDDVITLFKKMYCVNKPVKTDEIDESLASDEQTAQMIRNINETKKKYGKHSKYGMTLNSMIESVASCSHGYTFFNVYDLTVYLLHRVQARMDIEKNYENLMRGLYSGMGTVDPKKTNIAEEHWSNDRDV